MSDQDKSRVLLVGESWVTSATHYKGWDQFGSVSFHLGARPFVDALADSRYAVTYMPSHDAAEQFPLELEGLQEYDAIIFSDVGANTLLLHPEVWLHGRPMPNRLKLVESYVAAGGGFMMFGGYLSFQGINGSARFRGTPIERILPVSILPYDDRIEVPEGFKAEIARPDHPILAGLDGDWPLLLGVNEVQAKTGEGVEVLATLPGSEGGHPLLVTGRHGNGRTMAWTSDVGPHWVPQPFVDWPGYARLWRQALDWITG